MKFQIEILKSLSYAINKLTRLDLADLRIPEYISGEALCSENGSTCIILEVYPNTPDGIEYTILWDGEVHTHVLETSLSGWEIISDTSADPFMLSF